MEQVLQTLGRKQMQLEELDAGYTRLLNVLAGVVSGEIDRQRVLVNLTERKWEVAEEGQRPGVPATLNGFPQVVVAPEETV